MTPANTNCPTPKPELNGVLHELVTSAQAVRGDNFIAAWRLYSQVGFRKAAAFPLAQAPDRRLTGEARLTTTVEENVLVGSKIRAPTRPSSRRSPDRR
jgi:hypothetical protein